MPGAYARVRRNRLVEDWVGRVVYGSAYGAFGHIGTVRGVLGDRYEVIEQNFLDFNQNLEPHWHTFDLRSVARPDPAVVGFVVAPPVR